jgi:uncharacterized membrane protein
MPKACPQCGFQMPDVAAFCPGCGLRMIVPRMIVPSAAAPGSIRSSGRDNIFGALAYVTFIPAVIFLLMERFKRDRFVRFHSFQSIFLVIAGIGLAIAMRLVFVLLALIPRLGYLMAWLAVVIVFIGWVILWMVLLIKALQGECFKLPWIGGWAERVEPGFGRGGMRFPLP